MKSFLSISNKKLLWYIFLFSLALSLFDYFHQKHKDAEWDRKIMQERHWERSHEQRQKEYQLTPEQKERQRKALQEGNNFSTEPLPSEVSPDDEEMYNWIIDHPEYDGDYEHFKDRYESEHGDYDDYEK